LTHPQEVQRQDVAHLLTANLSRVQEALRVLEEYAKLDRPALVQGAKALRYQIYSLESFLLGQPHRDRLNQAQLYLVTSPHDRLVAVVEAAIAGGVQIVQYRDKEAENGERFARAQALRECCRRHGVLFLVNDHVDLALAVDADGVHLGQKDLPIAVARQLLGAQKIIGRSTTNPEELAKALAEGADYVGVGPIYATPTKPGRAPAGLTYARHALDHCPIPWFAIGGIDLAHLPEVTAAGVQRVAVVREIMQAGDPAAVSRQLRQLLRTPETAISS
jgi:thiamine-phosphate pyrophosphorylase